MGDLTYYGYRIEYIAMIAHILTENGITPDKVEDWFSNAVKVVRCRDCKYYDLAPNGVKGMCERQYATFYVCDYCSYGKRKE